MILLCRHNKDAVRVHYRQHLLLQLDESALQTSKKLLLVVESMRSSVSVPHVNQSYLSSSCSFSSSDFDFNCDSKIISAHSLHSQYPSKTNSSCLYMQLWCLVTLSQQLKIAASLRSVFILVFSRFLCLTRLWHPTQWKWSLAASEPKTFCLSLLFISFTLGYFCLRVAKFLTLLLSEVMSSVCLVCWVFNGVS